MPSETTRILNLPTREPAPPDLCERLTKALRTSTGTQSLWQVQAESLLELVRQRNVSAERGVFVRAGLGCGKTLIGLLASTVVPPPAPNRRALYLCPAGLRDKTLRELPGYKRNWKIRPDLLIHSYEEVSADPKLLERLQVYLVICDECQALKRRSAARTSRVLRTARKNPDIIWVSMSATSSTKGLSDHAHLFELSLRDGSPLPVHGDDIEAWGRCTDSVVTAEACDWGLIRPLVERYYPNTQEIWDGPSGDRVRACRRAVDRRISETPGVVTGSSVDVDAELHLRRVYFPCPAEIESALTELARTGEIPGSSGAAAIGERDRARSENSLCMGGYYRWAWEKTSAGAPDTRWLQIRRDWSSVLSEFLAPDGHAARLEIDTPAQVVQRIDEAPRAVRMAWEAWLPERDRYRIQYLGDSPSGVGEVIPVEPVWLTYAIIERMMEYLKKDCILWYKHKMVAHELRRRGARVVLAGEDMPWREEFGDGRPVALNEFSHCEGFNLQAWDRMVVPCPGAAKNAPGAQIDQMIGRSHRYGQDSDKVVVDFWQHAEVLEANLDRAVMESQRIQDISGIPQRLMMGKWIVANKE